MNDYSLIVSLYALSQFDWLKESKYVYSPMRDRDESDEWWRLIGAQMSADYFSGNIWFTLVSVNAIIKHILIEHPAAITNC